MQVPVHVTRRSIRYSEADIQGVVFNAHYLTFCDDAMNDFLDATGLTYSGMMAAGYDMQVVHADVSWKSSFRPGDVATIRTRCRRIGTTSVVIFFAMSAADREVATAELTYVVIRTDGSGKTPVPDNLRRALMGPG